MSYPFEHGVMQFGRSTQRDFSEGVALGNTQQYHNNNNNAINHLVEWQVWILGDITTA